MATSEAQKRASMKYAAKNYKRVPLDLQADYFETVLKPAAAAAGIGVNTYIKEAIAEKIARDSSGAGGE